MSCDSIVTVPTHSLASGHASFTAVYSDSGDKWSDPSEGTGLSGGDDVCGATVSVVWTYGQNSIQITLSLSALQM